MTAVAAPWTLAEGFAIPSKCSKLYPCTARFRMHERASECRASELLILSSPSGAAAALVNTRPQETPSGTQWRQPPTKGFPQASRNNVLAPLGAPRIAQDRVCDWGVMTLPTQPDSSHSAAVRVCARAVFLGSGASPAVDGVTVFAHPPTGAPGRSWNIRNSKGPFLGNQQAAAGPASKSGPGPGPKLLGGAVLARRLWWLPCTEGGNVADWDIWAIIGYYWKGAESLCSGSRWPRRGHKAAQRNFFGFWFWRDPEWKRWKLKGFGGCRASVTSRHQG